MLSTAPDRSTVSGRTPTFANLGLPRDMINVLDKREMTTPFPIQEATIPDALAGRDVLGQGQTGSGKTLAFGLPLLARLAGGTAQPKRPRSLILAPTRELASQISEALEPYGSALRLRLKVVCGGTSMLKQIQSLQRGVDVLVATPGRLRDLIKRGTCSLEAVEIVVLDEADQMSDMGFLPEVCALLDQTKPNGQRMLFSATLGKEVQTLTRRYLTNPVTHSVDPVAGVVSTMSHHQVLVTTQSKNAMTAAIAGGKNNVIAFARTKRAVDQITGHLKEKGLLAAALHGGMAQNARTQTLNDLKAGKINVVVATNVAARGIDISGIDVVLHIDPAEGSTDYLHRAGRTARAGKSGAVVTLVLPHQQKTALRLFEQAKVSASRHMAKGTFDPELAALSGASSLSEVESRLTGHVLLAAEKKVERLLQQLEEAQDEVAALRLAATQPAQPEKTTPKRNPVRERTMKKPHRVLPHRRRDTRRTRSNEPTKIR